jgi:hypothetical protein
MKTPKYEYFLENRRSNQPNEWYRATSGFSSLEEAEEVVKNIVEKHKQACHYREDGSHIVQYRIIRVKTEVTENIMHLVTIDYPEPDSDHSDELHYLKQTFKYLKHLEHTYKVKMKNVQKAWDINNSLLYIERRMNELLSELPID